jgi:RNA polymerase primary sigma factor
MELIKRHAKTRKILSNEANIELIRRYQQDGCKKSLDALISHNLPMIMNVTFKFSSFCKPCFDVDDLFQVASMGMIRAIKKFDPDAGTAFSTYAFIWMRSFISRYIAEHRYAVKYPVYADSLIHSINRMKEKYSGETEEFFIKLVAFENGISEFEVRNRVIRGGTINEMQGEDDEQTGFDLSQVSVDPQESYAMVDLDAILGLLPDNIERILRLKADNWTYRQIGLEFGLSHERIRQLHDSGIARVVSIVKKTRRLHGI